MQDLFKAGLINNIQLWYGTHHVSSKYCFYSETLIILKFSLIMIKKKKKEKKRSRISSSKEIAVSHLDMKNNNAIMKVSLKTHFLSPYLLRRQVLEVMTL